MGLFERMWETLWLGTPAPPQDLEDRGDSGGLVHPQEHTTLTAWQERADSIYNPTTGLGSWKDKGAVARPNPWVIPLANEELDALRSYNGIASRIIKVLPERACAKGWTVPDVGLDEDKRLQSWTQIQQGMECSRAFGGSAMVLVTEDDIPPQFRQRPQDWLAQPLDMSRIGKLHALQVFDAFEAAPRVIDLDWRSPNYRNPLLWQISALGYTATIHHTRVVYFRGNRRSSQTLGNGWTGGNRMPDASVLQVVYDEIHRLTATMQGGAHLAQELREKVLKIGNFEQVMSGDQKGLLVKYLALMAKVKSMLGFTAIGPNDSYENQSNPPTGFKDLSDAQQEMLCLVLGWPRTMLNGESPGALGSGDESGLERERQITTGYQEQNRPQIEQLYTVLYASQDGPTRGQIPDEWEVTFHALNQPKEKEVLEVRKLAAEVDTLNVAMQVYGPEHVAESRYGPDGFSVEMLPVPIPDPEDIARLESDAQAAIAAEQPPEPDATREDADGDGLIILIPAAAPGMRGAVEKAIGQRVEVEDEPHVTVLYLGKGHTPEEVAEVAAVVAEEARAAESGVLERGTIRTFPLEADRVPVVIEFDGWSLERLHDRLLRRLAHLVRVRQFARYRPHITIGYAGSALTPAAGSALLALDVSGVRVALTELQVFHGELVAAAPVGG